MHHPYNCRNFFIACYPIQYQSSPNRDVIFKEEEKIYIYMSDVQKVGLISSGQYVKLQALIIIIIAIKQMLVLLWAIDIFIMTFFLIESNAHNCRWLVQLIDWCHWLVQLIDAIDWCYWLRALQLMSMYLFVLLRFYVFCWLYDLSSHHLHYYCNQCLC